MRKFLVKYWTEYQDEMTDFEVIVEAFNIKEALNKFEKTHRFKMIESIVSI